MKTQIKSHGDGVTDFYDKNIPKADSNHTCLTVISLDSSLKNDENYCPQVFLKRMWVYWEKIFRQISDNLSYFSSFD